MRAVFLWRCTLSAIVVGLCGGHSQLPASSQHWPLIKPVQEHYEFADVKKARLSLVIRGLDNRPLYRFHCNGMSALEPEDADSWADFSCHLHSVYTRDKIESLLIENASVPREATSRGEIWSHFLRGQCADYPDWGRIRSFRLRGMRLTFVLSNMKFAIDPTDPLSRKTEPLLESFQFKVTVVPDPKAHSAIAAPSAYELPREGGDGSLDCTVPVKRR